MEIEVVDSKKNYMQFYLVGETHTFCNVLRSVLAGNDSVKRVAYNIEHPVTHRTRPLFELETRGSTRPTTALRHAAKKLAKTCDELSEGFRKSLG